MCESRKKLSKNHDFELELGACANEFPNSNKQNQHSYFQDNISFHCKIHDGIPSLFPFTLNK